MATGRQDKARTALKPSEFSKVSQPGTQLAKKVQTGTFPKRPEADASARRWEKFEAEKKAFADSLVDQHTGFFTVGILMGRGGVAKDSMRVLDFTRFIEVQGELPEKEDILEQYREVMGRTKVGKAKTPVSQIADTRIITMRGRPKIDFNKQGELLQPNERKTVQQQIAEFVRDCDNIQKQTITIKNVVEMVQNSTYEPSPAALDKISPEEMRARVASKRKQTPLLASIMRTVTSKPDQGSAMFPLQIVDNIDDLPRKYGIALSNAITVDFGELISPIALVMGNVTGNAQRVSREFLGANTRQLMESATIHFNPAATGALYDSFIEYGGRVIGVSSKGAPNTTKPTSGTAMNGLRHAINDVKTNRESLRLLNELLKDRENMKMMKVVEALADSAAHGSNWTKTLRLLQLMYPEQYRSGDMFKDIKFLKSIVGELESTAYREADRSTRAAMTKKLRGGISDYLRSRYDRDAGRARKEDTTFFGKFMRLTNTEITDTLNNSSRFNDLVTWLLNHSALVQIDLFTAKDDAYGGRMVVTNIVATWPSTQVDSIKLISGTADDLRFMLAVNGYEAQFKNREDIPWVETDFRDRFEAKPGDRDGSTTITPQDWQQQGVTGPRTTTDLHDLPASTATFTQPTTRTKAAKMQASPINQPAQLTPVGAMKQFVTGLKDNDGKSILRDKSTTGNKLFAYVRELIQGTHRFPDGFEENFKALVAQPGVMALIKDKTRRLNDHPDNVPNLYESYLLDNDGAVVDAVAVLYWAWMTRAYFTKNPTGNQYRQALENVKQFLEALNITTNERERATQSRGIKRTGEIMAR